VTTTDRERTGPEQCRRRTVPCLIASPEGNNQARCVMIKKTILGLCLGLTMLGIAVAAPSADKNSQKFIKDVIEGNLAEVQVGMLAQDKSMDDGVRSFGGMLVKDYSTSNGKAVEVGKAIGVTLPTEPNSQQKAMYDKLSKLSGPAFDREFAKMMVDDHRKDIEEFEKEAQSQNDQVAAFAKDTLPTLHKRLDMAESLVKAKTASK
jgi:putative membrane protein